MCLHPSQRNEGTTRGNHETQNHKQLAAWQMKKIYLILLILPAYRAKTSNDRKQGKKGGKPTTVDPKNGFRKR